MTDCVRDDEGCIRCPELPEQAYVDGIVLLDSALGWNAGSNSASALDGAMHTRFQVRGGSVGVVAGFRGTRRDLHTDPTRIEHGIYVQNPGPVSFYSVMERGREKTTALECAEDDIFEIRRVGAVVTYLLNDAQVYESTAPSFGNKFVTACMYAAQDGIP